MDDNSRDTQWQEAIEELYGLVITVQEKGRRLAKETHGDSYDLVRELNELLHNARLTLDELKEGGG